MEELLHVVRIGQDDHLVGADLQDQGLELVERVVLDQVAPGLGPGRAQGR